MQFSNLVSKLALAIAVSACLSKAQSTPQDALTEGIANVTLQLEGARVIPNLFSADLLELRGLLTQEFANQNVSTGELVASTNDVANVPSWFVEYSSQANTSGQFSNEYYTIMTLDPGAASEQPRNIVRHFLANNVTLNTATGALMNTSEPIAGWFSPAPAAGDGIHRYTTLVFKQPANFTSNLPAYLQNRNETIDTNFNLTNYLEETKLGPIVAANFFLLENNDRSASTTATGVVSTSSVPSASVSALASSVSQSLSSAYATASKASTNAAVGSSMMVSQTGIALTATAFFVALGATLL